MGMALSPSCYAKDVTVEILHDNAIVTEVQQRIRKAW